MVKRRRKIRAKPKGKYKSTLEAQVAKTLGRRGRYEVLRLVYNPPPKTYVPDFEVRTKAGTYLLEVKGYLRYEDQVKMRAVKASNPELDIRFFFPRDNKVVGSKLLNSEWCTKYGYQYAIGELPESWVE